MARRLLLGALVLCAAAGLWKGVPAAAEFIRIDGCLDQGGRYDYAARRCDSAPAPVTAKAAAAEPNAADTVRITGPTVVAYFAVTQAEVDAGGDVVEALADFQHYLPAVERGLAGCGVKMVETYDAPVLVARGAAVERFVPRTQQAGAGYRLMGPRLPDHTLEGVHTDSDLLAAVAEHFRLPDDCWRSTGASPG